MHQFGRVVVLDWVQKLQAERQDSTGKRKHDEGDLYESLDVIILRLRNPSNWLHKTKQIYHSQGHSACGDGDKLWYQRAEHCERGFTPAFV